jgi:hypothetical protein
VTRAIDNGYLVLADLSGFTAFLAESEIDHAQAILEQILANLVASLTPALRLSEIEGDAVFVYAPEASVGRGELIAELVEDAYIDFRNLRETMVRNATCPCRACQAIGDLDLKFVVHAGEFVLHDLSGVPKPMGSAVNLAHRLLKNDVETETGWRAYVLYTREALTLMGMSPEPFHAGVERYEHLGMANTYTAPLEAVYVASRRAAVCFIGPENAHVVVEHDFPVARSVIWDWLNDMNKRTCWTMDSRWSVMERPGGRTAKDARNHCATHNVIEQVIDWRPFEYYTVRLKSSPREVLVTVQLSAIPTGTRLRWFLRVDSRLPRWMLVPAARWIVTRTMQLEAGLERLGRLVAGEGPGLTRENG